MRPVACWLLVTAALAACSSSSSGGGTGSGSGGASTSPASSASSSGAGGDGGTNADLDPYGASFLAWKGLQGAFDSLGQEPHVEGGYVPPSARRLVGCAVGAPELGEHVVYLERAAVDDGAALDRQFLVVLDDPG